MSYKNSLSIPKSMIIIREMFSNKKSFGVEKNTLLVGLRPKKKSILTLH